VPNIRIEPARERDAPVILHLIKGLAEYEKLADQAVASEEDIRASLFGSQPAAEVALAYEGDRAVGFALFYHNYSTFLGRRGMYLEDLFVVPEYRGRGIGRALLAHVAAIAVERRCGRFEWAVLDWNEPAIGFYRQMGARVLDDWRICRVTGDALVHLASL
jgi:GNAT superfamily N-acetyltransferase